MLHLDDHQKKHLVLWTAVGGTTAVIVALWAFVLPQQLARFSSASGDGSLTRWMSAQQPADSGEKQQTFMEVLQAQRARLDAVANSQASAGKTGNNVNIDELRAKINSALNTNAASNANLNAPTDLNLNAPAKP